MSDLTEIEQAIVRLLAGREHSRAELIGKLRGRGFATEDLETVLDDLADRDLQSDQRFSEQFVASRVARGSGPLRIRAELRQRGASDELIECCLEQDPEAWQELLQAVHDRKYGTEPARDRKEQARRSRFLASRGFTGEQIQRLLRQR